jgi:hypothetical protein
MCSTSTSEQRGWMKYLWEAVKQSGWGGWGATTYKAGGSTQLLPTHTTIADREKRSNIFSVVIYLIYRAKQTKQRCFPSLSYTVKKAFRYSRPQPGCHLPNYPWAGVVTSYINYSRLGRVWYRKWHPGWRREYRKVFFTVYCLYEAYIISRNSAVQNNVV